MDCTSASRLLLASKSAAALVNARVATAGDALTRAPARAHGGRRAAPRDEFAQAVAVGSARRHASLPSSPDRVHVSVGITLSDPITLPGAQLRQGALAAPRLPSTSERGVGRPSDGPGRGVAEGSLHASAAWSQPVHGVLRHPAHRQRPPSLVLPGYIDAPPSYPSPSASLSPSPSKPRRLPHFGTGLVAAARPATVGGGMGLTGTERGHPTLQPTTPTTFATIEMHVLAPREPSPATAQHGEAPSAPPPQTAQDGVPDVGGGGDDSEMSPSRGQRKEETRRRAKASLAIMADRARPTTFTGTAGRQR